MTTKQIERMIKAIEKTKYKIMKAQIIPLDNDLCTLRTDRIKSIIKSKEYIIDLSEYNGKQLSDITALSSNGRIIDLPTDEIVEVQKGKLYCSSYTGGIVEWHPQKKMYYKSFYGMSRKLDIIGFIDIQVKTEDEY